MNNMLEKLNIMVVYIGGPKEADKDSKKKLRRCGMIANEITIHRPIKKDANYSHLKLFLKYTVFFY